MHRFHYRGRSLYSEEVKIENIIKRYGTPLYIYSANTILDHFTKLKDAFRELNPLICFSMKSNSNLAVLKLLINKGSGIDVVSKGEMYKAIKAGCPVSKIVYAGVGKRADEIEFAIKRGIFSFNVESLSELERIDAIARKLKRVQRVCLRLNPDIDPKTHKFITTGKKETKFGLSYEVVKNILLTKSKYRNLKISGIHLHIGSQIIYNEPFMKAVKVALKLRNECNCDFQYLNIGGGLGIIYKDEKALTAKDYSKEIKELLRGKNLKLILEPGRFIVGNAGILVTRIEYVKEGINKKFAIVDAGMNLLIRPALYSAYHKVMPLKISIAKKELYDIVGPVCESSDFLALGRKLPLLKESDLIAVYSCGAYGFVMASNYNAHPRCAEVLVNNNRFYLVRKPESYQDLVKYDLIPDFLR